MLFHPERTAIVGATGPTDLRLARELVSRGRGVRVVSRRRDHLEQVFAGLPVEVATADALDAESLARAVEGCDLALNGLHCLDQRQVQSQKSKPQRYLQRLGIQPQPMRSMQIAWGGVDPVSVVQP